MFMFWERRQLLGTDIKCEISKKTTIEIGRTKLTMAKLRVIKDCNAEICLGMVINLFSERFNEVKALKYLISSGK